MLCVLNDILCSTNRGDFVLLVLLDLSATFDTTDHSILLKRLQDEVGISDLSYQWFQSYLAYTYQFNQVNMASSNSADLPCCVSPGSVLGPVFLLSKQFN